VIYKAFVLISMRAVGAEGECAGELRSAGGVVPFTHNASYHTIYQLSIDIHEVLVSELVRGGVAENGGPTLSRPERVGHPD
jgi:hypothetical protein